MGAEKGLLLFEPKKRMCKRLPVEQKLDKKEALAIRSIAVTKDGGIWLGSN